MFYKKLVIIILAMMLAVGVGVVGVPGIISAVNDTMQNVTMQNDTTQNGTVQNGETTITSTPSEIRAGEPFDLTVTQENTGDEPLTGCGPYVWVGGIDPATGTVIDINIDDTGTNGWAMGKDDVHYVSGDTNNNGYLDPGETWTWVISGLVLQQDVVIIAKGHSWGLDSGNNVTWPDYPDQRAILKIHTASGQLGLSCPGFSVQAGDTFDLKVIEENT